MKIFLRCAGLLALLVYMLRQARRPSSFIGKLILRGMNESHSTMTDWGLAHIHVDENFTIMDVGCGGGRTIEKLARLANRGMVYGVDYSQASVAASRAHNTKLVESGRVGIAKASVSRLPFPEDTFNLVTACETQYYWPDLMGDMREICRVLKPGGKLIIIAETYKGGKYDRFRWPIMWLLRSSHLSVADQRNLFSAAGYTSVEIHEELSRGWICAIGTKECA